MTPLNKGHFVYELNKAKKQCHIPFNAGIKKAGELFTILFAETIWGWEFSFH
jgi:hypothetical protein